MSEKPKIPTSARADRLWCAVLLTCLAACGPFAVDPAADLMIHGARVWDGTGTPMRGPIVVQIGGGRILSIEPVPGAADLAALASAAGVAAVDAGGM